MKQKKIKGIIILCTLVIPLVVFSAQKTVYEYTQAEKKAIRREMIEMDIAARNIGSIISAGTRRELPDNFARLQTWQTLEHPVHKTGIASAKEKWKAAGLLKFKEKIHREASALRSYAAGAGASINWDKVSQGYVSILANCRGCHQKTMKRE